MKCDQLGGKGGANYPPNGPQTQSPPGLGPNYYDNDDDDDDDSDEDADDFDDEDDN